MMTIAAPREPRMQRSPRHSHAAVFGDLHTPTQQDGLLENAGLRILDHSWWRHAGDPRCSKGEGTKSLLQDGFRL